MTAGRAVPRRELLAGAGAVGAAGLLAGCGADSPPRADSTLGTTPTPAAAPGTPAPAVQRRLAGEALDKYVLTFGGGYFFVPPAGPGSIFPR